MSLIDHKEVRMFRRYDIVGTANMAFEIAIEQVKANIVNQPDYTSVGRVIMVEPVGTIKWPKNYELKLLDAVAKIATQPENLSKLTYPANLLGSISGLVTVEGLNITRVMIFLYTGHLGSKVAKFARDIINNKQAGNPRKTQSLITQAKNELKDEEFVDMVMLISGIGPEDIPTDS